MSIRVWIGRNHEIFKKPSGPSDVVMKVGLCKGEHVISISRTEMGVPRDIVIGGNDVVQLLSTLAREPRYRGLFHPEWVGGLRSGSPASDAE